MIKKYFLNRLRPALLFLNREFFILLSNAWDHALEGWHALNHTTNMGSRLRLVAYGKRGEVFRTSRETSVETKNAITVSPRQVSVSLRGIEFLLAWTNERAIIS
jgi:hypothetical protein